MAAKIGQAAPMVATLFSSALLCVTLLCGLAVARLWRNPDNWHLDGESGQIEFHSWADLGIYAVIGALCLIFGLLGLVA